MFDQYSGKFSGENTINTGDFKSHLLRWRYKYLKPQGKIMEDFLDSLVMTLVQETGHTFLYFKGNNNKTPT